MASIKYGVIIGKFSKCWHNGHQSIVDAVRADGLEPILFIGSSQYFNTTACPLHIQTRMDMIKLVNPSLRMYAIHDKDCWTDWHKQLVDCIKLVVTPNLDEVTIYTHNKPEDLHEHFTFNGTDYYNEYYSKIFEVEGLNTTNLPISGIDIRGTKVHEDLEANKHFLDPKVYIYLLNQQHTITIGDTFTINAMDVVVTAIDNTKEYNITVTYNTTPLNFKWTQLITSKRS